MTQTSFDITSNSGYVFSNYTVGWPPDAGVGSVTSDPGYTVGSWADGYGYFTYLSYLEFDTSGLPDTDVIHSAELHVNFSAKAVQQTATAKLMGQFYDYGASLTSGDWIAAGSLTGAAYNELANSISTGWNVLPIKSAVLSSISKTGKTRMAFGINLTSGVPNITNSLTWYLNNATYKAHLVVNHLSLGAVDGVTTIGSIFGVPLSGISKVNGV